MDDANMHIYNVIGYRNQGEGHELHDKTERASYIDEVVYMSMQDPQQEGSSEYHAPQWCASYRNIRAVNEDDSKVKGSSDHCHMLKDDSELKQIKICLYVLSLLGVTLSLMTIASLVLAAYAFYTTGSSASKEIHRLQNRSQLWTTASKCSQRDRISHQYNQ